MKVKGIAETKSGSELIVEVSGVSPNNKLINTYRYIRKELEFMISVTSDTMLSMTIDVSLEEGETV